MTSLAVLAHHDPQGAVAPHVLHVLDELATVADRVVLVSMDYLTPTAVAALADVQLLHCDGRGGFGAWSHALEAVLGGPERLADLTRLVLVDHTLVGPTRRLSQVLPAGHGGARSLVPGGPGPVRLDHRLVDLGAELLADPRTAAFFTGVRSRASGPGADARIAVDLGRFAAAGGYRVDAVFEPTVPDRVQVAAGELRGGPTAADPSAREWVRGVVARHGAAREAWAWPWAAVRSGRLPFVPVDRLRSLSPAALDALAGRFPAALDGVPAYLDRTALLAPRSVRRSSRRP